MYNRIKKHLKRGLKDFVFTQFIKDKDLFSRQIEYLLTKKSNVIESHLLPLLRRKPEWINRLFLGLRPELLAQSETVPSAFNNGYLHIEKTIQLVGQLNLPADGLVIDVGAAAGIISGMFAEAFPRVSVYAFEPIADSYNKLKEKQTIYSNIIPAHKALGSTTAEVEINIASRITSSSIFELNPGDDHNFITENIALDRKEKITISTMDAEVPANRPVLLMKLDVQGYELEVLKGATATLARTSIVLAEVSNHNYYANGAQYYQIDDFLRRHGFQLFTIVPSLREKGKMLEWDCIYTNTRLVKI